MTIRKLTRRILQCTPRELQTIISIIHGWAADFGDESVKEVKTVQQIIDLLSRPDYLEEAKRIERITKRDYFEMVFNI